jgi:histidinol-phosphate phosphatase family protein
MTTNPDTNPGRPAIFLDRDGTIIDDLGFVSDPDLAVLLPGTVEALRLLQPRYDFFMVTNQVGIARGLLTVAEVDAVNGKIVGELAQAGIVIRRTYVCPHERSENCVCHKPKPYFLHQAAAEFGTDLANSYTIGDHEHDVTFGESVGGAGIFVLTGHGSKHAHELRPETVVVADLLAAAKWIVARGTVD